MMLVSCHDLSKSYGSRPLFRGLSFGLRSGDRVGLMGPNGSGKSTLLKILVGEERPDEGEVVCGRHVRIGYVPQESLFPSLSIHCLALKALEGERHLSEEERGARAAISLTQAGFADLQTPASSLSGGWAKRLALALALVQRPDLLLLDEPTNHLDLEGVVWLEHLLQRASFAYLAISHDRRFLERTTNRMMELDASYPKGLFAVEGSYTLFLEKREAFLNGQIQQERSLNSKVRRELEWLRQHPKARTTRSQSRVQEAERLVGEWREVKNRNVRSRSQFDFTPSARQSRRLLTATHLAKSLGGRLLFSGIDLVLSPGMRLGVVGINGSGKSTLLRLLAGEEAPDKGTVKSMEGVKTVYFDQHRLQLPPDISLRRALCSDGERVFYRNQTIHVNSWCRRFLFAPERLDLPFGRLSGGEKARVHIARLMLQPADILLLDEPTNDLDIPTLEILESSLLDFAGAVVLISHDRYLLDHLCTLILGLDGANGHEWAADYSQWERLQLEKSSQPKPSASKKSGEGAAGHREAKSRKMTYAQRHEANQIEERIAALEREIALLSAAGSDPDFIREAERLRHHCEQLGLKQQALEQLYRRWQELEEGNG